MLDRPILITGTPRSGKTCVFNVLKQAEEFYSVQEPILLWQPPGRHVDDRCGPSQATERTKARIRSRCKALLRAAGKPRYLDNLSYHAIRLPYVRKIMPEARVIHVVRDPMDCVPEIAMGWTRKTHLAPALRRRAFRECSPPVIARMAMRFLRNYLASLNGGARQTWGPVVPDLADYRKDHTVVEVAAFQWMQMVRIAIDDIESLADLPTLDIRYERLVSEPAVEAARIAEFAEVRQPQCVIDHAREHLSADYVHHRPTRREHTIDELDAIRQIVAPVASRMGYELPRENPQ